MNLLHTRTQINGDKFLIVYLMLFSGGIATGLLPLFILIAPMKLIWMKPKHRIAWRTVSAIWLVLSITIGAILAFSSRMHPNGETLHGFPLQFPADPMFGADLALYGWIFGLNISVVTGILTLPLSIASYIETKKRSRAIIQA